MATNAAAVGDTDRQAPWRLVAPAALGLVVLLVLYWPAGGYRDTRDLPPRYPTEGKVFYNGKPLRGGVVTFNPLPLSAGSKTWTAIVPRAVIVDDGTYRLNTYDAADGAVLGEYAVTVIWEESRPGPDALKGRFSDPTRPVLKVKITEGTNSIPTINLKGPPINLKGHDDHDHEH